MKKRFTEQQIIGFRDPKHTQVFLSSVGPIRQHFALKRHLLRASFNRKHLAARFSMWRDFTEAPPKSACSMKQQPALTFLVNILR
ncbi:hypothetical protein WL35_23485 [Burkholderia ubonensis]|nr:hypothetical protein WL35_23485 [Burkholderia ubonensis]